MSVEFSKKSFSYMLIWDCFDESKFNYGDCNIDAVNNKQFPIEGDIIALMQEKIESMEMNHISIFAMSNLFQIGLIFTWCECLQRSLHHHCCKESNTNTWVSMLGMVPLFQIQPFYPLKTAWMPLQILQHCLFFLHPALLLPMSFITQISMVLLIVFLIITPINLWRMLHTL